MSLIFFSLMLLCDVIRRRNETNNKNKIHNRSKVGLSQVENNKLPYNHLHPFSVLLLFFTDLCEFCSLINCQ